MKLEKSNNQSSQKREELRSFMEKTKDQVLFKEKVERAKAHLAQFGLSKELSK